MDPNGPVARRFPLVPRPRRPCIALNARVGELCALARAADRDDDVVRVSAVHNQAALLASDCGLPDLARQWCHRHANAHLRTLRPGVQAARCVLEPLINLARLDIRESDGDAALRLLDTLYEAVISRTATVIDGILLPAETLTRSPDDHRELCQWLWTIYLADGTRALTSAGRWQEAHARFRRNNGVGQRMFDGRQVAVIENATAGKADRALMLLEDTAPGEPWESTVTACLRVLCRQYASQPVDQDLAVMLERYKKLNFTPRLAVFHTRLGLTVFDAAVKSEHPGSLAVATDLIRRTTQACDGYMARDVLAHEDCASLLTDRQAHRLGELLKACGLGKRTIPEGLRAELSIALETSEAVITRVAGRPATATEPVQALSGVRQRRERVRSGVFGRGPRSRNWLS